MIKLPSGRTVSCTTENFPEPVLRLVLPTPVAVEAGSPVSISIFHGHREVVLSAMVLTRRDLALSLSVAEATLSDYQNFAVSALSRGPEWPKWLPGQRADRPLPKWVTDNLIAGSIAVLDFATNINKHLRWVRLDSWIQLWKKKK
jgi:cellulose synthase (UDP-forming)